MDFTLSTYRTMIKTLQQQGFSFLTFEEFLNNPAPKSIVLRHDVDALPQNSLAFARIQAEKGINATYYFRIVPESFDENIIKEIYSLGHEIGYHYEDVSLMAERRKEKGERRKWHNDKEYEKYLVEIAIESFAKNLEKLRRIVPVKTICMHGRPTSRWDSRLLWKYYDYHDFGIIGEPYFDVDFDEVLYLTDTGRRWDGDSFNVRDKAQGSAYAKASAGKAGLRAQGKSNRLPVTDYRLPFPSFHSTFDIIRAAEKGQLPDKIMMTFHPQRWTDKPLPWVKELVWQNVKNVGKFFVVKYR